MIHIFVFIHIIYLIAAKFVNNNSFTIIPAIYSHSASYLHLIHPFSKMPYIPSHYFQHRSIISKNAIKFFRSTHLHDFIENSALTLRSSEAKSDGSWNEQQKRWGSRSRAYFLPSKLWQCQWFAHLAILPIAAAFLKVCICKKRIEKHYHKLSNFIFYYLSIANLRSFFFWIFIL